MSHIIAQVDPEDFALDQGLVLVAVLVAVLVVVVAVAVAVVVLEVAAVVLAHTLVLKTS